MATKQPCTYLLASKKHGTLYIGVTSNLEQRMFAHKTEASAGFSERYQIKKLVYYEFHDSMEQAILREKCMKKWNRDWKIRLIEQHNPDWDDLAIDWYNK